MERSKKMNLNEYFKSVIDVDRCQVVICDMEHRIIYMNPSAIKRYEKRGGEKLVGRSIFECHNPESCKKIQEVVEWFSRSAENNIVYTFHNEKENKDVYMVALRDDSGRLIGYYEKHEYRNRETGGMYAI